MQEILLHQYETSPFSEKIRRLLGLKNLAWRAVEQPLVNPKPALVPLTGGYRKIPVMQIGADVWCDTAVIAPKLDEIAPEPSCFPGGSRGAAEIIAYWADHRFFLASVPPVIVKVLPNLPPEFVADRAAMSPGFSAEALRAALPDARSQLVAGIDWLDRQLDGRRFLLGDAFSLADAACYHVLWFLRNDPEAFAVVERRPKVKAWFDRAEGLGRGSMKPMEREEALAVARKSQPVTRDETDGSDPNGIRPGDRVTVRADDYGADPITGVAVVVTAQEIALRREHPEVGEVVVHFPRSGFRVARG
jgi:glutathione S-transferase